MIDNPDFAAVGGPRKPTKNSERLAPGSVTHRARPPLTSGRASGAAGGWLNALGDLESQQMVTRQKACTSITFRITEEEAATLRQLELKGHVSRHEKARTLLRLALAAAKAAKESGL